MHITDFHRWLSVIVMFAGFLIYGTKQWVQVHRNKKDIAKVDKHCNENMKDFESIVGRWKDGTDKRLEELNKELSNLRGSFDTMFSWLRKNGNQRRK